MSQLRGKCRTVLDDPENFFPSNIFQLCCQTFLSFSALILLYRADLLYQTVVGELPRDCLSKLLGKRGKQQKANKQLLS